MTSYTFGALFLVALIPPLAILLLPQNRSFFDRPIVRGFGLGVYTALIAILLEEAFTHGGKIAGIWFAVGIALSFVIGFFVKEFHHHHDHAEKAHRHNKASMFRILISDFFHNIVDGIAIVASFTTNPGVGFTSLAGILGHQVIQQGGQQILLVESGITPKKALVLSFFISLSVFLGLIISGETIEAIFISLSAGIVLWKVLTDIRHTKWTPSALLGFALGALVLGVLLVAIPHEH